MNDDGAVGDVYLTHWGNKKESKPTWYNQLLRRETRWVRSDCKR